MDNYARLCYGEFGRKHRSGMLVVRQGKEIKKIKLEKKQLWELFYSIVDFFYYEIMNKKNGMIRLVSCMDETTQYEINIKKTTKPKWKGFVECPIKNKTIPYSHCFMCDWCGKEKCFYNKEPWRIKK